MENKFQMKQDSLSSKSNIIKIVAGVVVIAIIVAVILLVALPKGDGSDTIGGDGGGSGYSGIEENTEEDKRITKETLDKIVDVEIGGYYYSEENPVSKDVVEVSIRNKSDKTVPIGVIIGAYDSNGELLETSALYAESADPNVTQRFELFAYTELTPEQLKNSTYKVYKAWTYSTTASEPSTEETTIVEEPEPVVDAEPEYTETESTEDENIENTEDENIEGEE